MNNDCLLSILSLLPISDIINCSLINKHFNHLSKNNLIWLNHFKLFFPKYFSKCTNYYDNFKQYYTLNKFTLKHCSISVNKINEFWHSYEKFYVMPESICLLKQLTKIAIFGNNIKILPETITQLCNLRYLRIEDNDLTFLPYDIGNLTNLQELSLFGNKLQSIPSSIGNLKKLEELRLSNNCLKTVPHTVEQLMVLNVLTLFDNPFIHLPNTLSYLSTLQKLVIDNKHSNLLPKDINRNIIIIY